MSLGVEVCSTRLTPIITVNGGQTCHRATPCWGTLQRSPGPLAGFKRPTSKGRNGRKDGREGQVSGRMERRGTTRGMGG